MDQRTEELCKTRAKNTCSTYNDRSRVNLTQMFARFNVDTTSRNESMMLQHCVCMIAPSKKSASRMCPDESVSFRACRAAARNELEMICVT